jgi:hypothetical protein
MDEYDLVETFERLECIDVVNDVIRKYVGATNDKHTRHLIKNELEKKLKYCEYVPEIINNKDNIITVDVTKMRRTSIQNVTIDIEVKK